MGEVTRDRSNRRYPRSARVNEVVHEALADELERLSDPRLELVTITDVEVTPDLRHAKVFFSARRDPETAGAGLRAAGSHLRGSLGRQVRLKYTPRLEFVEDPAIAAGERVEEIIRNLHADDAGEEP